MDSMERIMLVIFSQVNIDKVIDRAFSLVREFEGELFVTFVLEEEIPASLSSLMMYTGFLGEKIKEDVEDTLDEQYQKRVDSLLNQVAKRAAEQDIKVKTDLVKKDSLLNCHKLINRRDIDYLIVNYTRDKIISQTVFKYFNKEFTDELKIPYELYMDGKLKKRKDDKMKKIMIPLAEGMEELEAITIIDVLRRAGVKVVTASLGEKEVRGDHNIIITADTSIDNIQVEELSGIILPGGMPGAKHLKNDARLIDLIRQVNNRQGLVAAICAAPIALQEAGVIADKKVTSYPGFEKEMPACKYQEERVVVDGNIITGRGPGVAMEFALEVVSYLVGEDKAEELREAMLVK